MKNIGFQTKILNEIINDMPASVSKMNLLLLFSLIDGNLTGELSDEDFLNDIKVLLSIDLGEK